MPWLNSAVRFSAGKFSGSAWMRALGVMQGGGEQEAQHDDPVPDARVTAPGVNARGATPSQGPPGYTWSVGGRKGIVRTYGRARALQKA